MGGMATPDCFYDAALVCITLTCDRCHASLDPDDDLGPSVSFETDGWFVALGDEAYRLGWLVEIEGNDIRTTCPACAAGRLPNS
jgi:hypothetical protein